MIEYVRMSKIGGSAMNDIWGFLLSYVFVFAIIALAELLRFFFKLSGEFTRKFIHIGVGHWVIAATFLIENRWIAIIPPLTFMGINYLSMKRNLFKAMDTQSQPTYGTVYYAFSLTLLTALFWTPSLHYLLLLGVMIMAWGDGLAAVVGKQLGKKELPLTPFKKTYLGSATMLVVSYIVALIIFNTMAPATSISYQALAIITAVLATILEAFTGKGWDNIAVPLGTAIIIYLIGVI